MATIDVDKLRDYMLGYCGTAIAVGSPAAFVDMLDVESASGEELCAIAERMGVDLERFAIGDDTASLSKSTPCSPKRGTLCSAYLWED